MCILSNIIAALNPPPVKIGGDDANNDFKGSGLACDKVTFDATQNLGENFKAVKGADLSCLDGGLGIDTLTIKLTKAQHDAMKAELAPRSARSRPTVSTSDELISLSKIALGLQSVKFESIGVELKGWECIKYRNLQRQACCKQGRSHCL